MPSRPRSRRQAERLPLSNPTLFLEKTHPFLGAFSLFSQELQYLNPRGYNAPTFFMDPLAKLFGSPARVKLLRLFLFNEETAFLATDAIFRARLTKEAGRKELNQLVSIGVVRKKAGKEGTGYIADRKFRHYEALKVFLRESTDVSDTEIVAALKKAGSVRLVVLSGLFTGAVESKVDLLIVGDRLEERPLGSAIRLLEAELGRELRYACFTSEQFKYRLGVYDRLLRDVFDYPNRVILDKIGLAAK